MSGHTITVFSGGADGAVNMCCSCRPEMLWVGSHIDLLDLAEIANGHLMDQFPSGNDADDLLPRWRQS